MFDELLFTHIYCKLDEALTRRAKTSSAETDHYPKVSGSLRATRSGHATISAVFFANLLL